METDIGARFLFSADSAIEDKVRRGEFRADLFYRISTVSIFIPPLRERKNDILPLLRHFCAQKGVPFDLGEASRRRLLQYPWPGNIRELENFVSGLAVRGCALDEKGAWTPPGPPRAHPGLHPVRGAFPRRSGSRVHRLPAAQIPEQEPGGAPAEHFAQIAVQQAEAA